MSDSTSSKYFNASFTSDIFSPCIDPLWSTTQIKSTPALAEFSIFCSSYSSLVEFLAVTEIITGNFLVVPLLGTLIDLCYEVIFRAIPFYKS